MPTNALTVVHKLLRKRLFDLSDTLFRATTEQGPAIARSLSELAEFLHQHAAHEDTGFTPRAREKDPELADRLERQHVEQERDLAEMQEAAAALATDLRDGPEILLRLHLDWNRFVGAMLLHLDDEERLLAPLIEDVIPPVDVLGQSALAVGPDEAARFLAELWNVVTPEERATIERARLALSA